MDKSVGWLFSFFCSPSVRVVICSCIVVVLLVILCRPKEKLSTVVSIWHMSELLVAGNPNVFP